MTVVFIRRERFGDTQTYREEGPWLWRQGLEYVCSEQLQAEGHQGWTATTRSKERGSSFSARAFRGGMALLTP